MATGDEHQIKGKISKVKGAVKEGIGALTGDRTTEAEGKAERAKGAVQDAYGKVKNDVTRDKPPKV